MMAAELESDRLKAEGICPGWNHGVPLDGYMADQLRRVKYPKRCPSARRRITRGDLCGICANARERERTHIDQVATERERRMQRDREHSYALNLALMLTDIARALGVDFEAEGAKVTLDRQSAGALLKYFETNRP